MDDNVNWDKVNRGKVRYGFALELYKQGKMLVPSELGRIESFVDYVMEGVEYEQPNEGSNAEPTPKVPIKDVVPEIEKANERKFVEQLVTVEADGLKDPDRDRVLKALKDGKITKENLQASLDKIQEIRKGYKDE
jgi:hypothetical protein|tara:strand:+ start:3732 stop:4136 length:405 start_codon:yes stop_codon:yes gene_type:complete